MIIYDLIGNKYINLFLTLSSFIAIGLIIWLISFCYHVLLKKEKWNVKLYILIPIIIISIFGFYDIIKSSFFEDTNLRSRYEKNEYQNHYYAYIYSSDDVFKCYKLPVKISSFVNKYENYSERIYNLLYIYFPNAPIRFEDQIIEPFTKTQVKDINDNYWYVELVNEDCSVFLDTYSPPDFNSTSNKSEFQIKDEQIQKGLYKVLMNEVFEYLR